METAYLRIIVRLRNVRPDQAKTDCCRATCPVCCASGALLVRRVGTGKLVVSCRNQCPYGGILKAIGFTQDSLYEGLTLIPRGRRAGFHSGPQELPERLQEPSKAPRGPR